jgi:carboxymethylenebutenolidase
MEPGDLQRVWDDHQAAEFVTKDAEAALRLMVDEPSVRIMANEAGGQGKEEVRAFYANVLIPQWPADAEMKPMNRIVGHDQLVDEAHLRFTHSQQMDWLLPGVGPTNRAVEMDVVIVAQFRDDLIAGERIYWDQASVLKQVGLLSM